MRTNLFLALTIFGAAAAAPFNPGLVFRVHKKHFAEIFKVAVPIANPFLKNNVITDPISVGILKITETNLSIEDIRSDRVVNPDSTQKDFLRFEIRDSKFHMVSKGRIDAAIFKSDGTIHADGVIPLVRVKVGFQDFNATHHSRPYVHFDLEELEFDKKSLRIHLDFKGIPNFLINQIVDIFKGVVTGKLRDAIKKFFRENGNKLINKAIHTGYPLSVPIAPLGISLQTAVNLKPSIDDHDVVMGIDGTFFDTKSGYKRDKDAPKVEGDALANFFGDASVTSYTFNSFLDALRGRDIAANVQGIDLLVRLENNQPVSISADGIHAKQLDVMVRGNKGKSYVEGRLDFASTLWMGIHKSLDFFLDTDIRNFGINSFDFKTNFPVIGHLKPLIPYAINAFIRYFHRLSLDIPDVVLPFDLKVKDLGLVLTDEILQLGVSVQIDHVTQLIARLLQRFADSQALTSDTL